jgi:hypothetical protein
MDEATAIELVNEKASNIIGFTEELKANKNVVMAAVKNRGMVLEYASNDLKKDFDVVLAAVKQFGSALKYASDELKDTEEIVIAAIQQNYSSINYASPKLKEKLKDLAADIREKAMNDVNRRYGLFQGRGGRRTKRKRNRRRSMKIKR